MKIYMTPATVRTAATRLASLSRNTETLAERLYVRHLLPGDNGEIPPALLESIRNELGRSRDLLHTIDRESTADRKEFIRRVEIVERELAQAKREFMRPPKKDDSIWGSIKNALKKFWDWIKNLGIRGAKFLIVDDLLALTNRELVLVDGKWVVKKKKVSWLMKAAIIAAWGIPIPGGRVIGKAGIALIKAIVKVFKKGFGKAIDLLGAGKVTKAVEKIKDALANVLKSSKGLALTMEGKRILAQRRLGELARSNRTIVALEKKVDDLAAGSASRTEWAATKIGMGQALTSISKNLVSGNTFEGLLGILTLGRIPILGKTIPTAQGTLYEKMYMTTAMDARAGAMMDLATGASSLYTGALNAGETAGTMRDKVSTALEVRRAQLSDAAYRDAKALIDWFYGNQPGPPPRPTRPMMDVSMDNLATSVRTSLVNDLRAQL